MTYVKYFTKYNILNAFIQIFDSEWGIDDKPIFISDYNLSEEHEFSTKALF